MQDYYYYYSINSINLIQHTFFITAKTKTKTNKKS